MTTSRRRVLSAVRANAPGAIVELVVNVALPYLIYAYGKPSLGDVRALLASSVPPLVWSVVGLVRKRSLDLLSIFVLVGIVLSLLAFVGGGGVKLLQLRENLVTGIFALAFLGSLAIGRPLIYELARASMRRRSADELAAFERAGAQNPNVMRSMRFMTLVWGTGLALQTALACVLVFVVSIKTYLLVSPFLSYGTMAVLVLWNWWYVRNRRQTAARRPAEVERA